MLNKLPRPLPRACLLPHRYHLELVGQRRGCQYCNGPLKRVRTSTHFPVGFILGQPQVKLIHRKCDSCGKPDPLDEYQQLVPPHGNYAYDLIVHVGLSRLQDQRQDVEIVNDLFQRYGLQLPQGSVRSLVDSFLDGLAAVHQAHTPELRQCLVRDGGYALHLDGTCECDTDVLFVAMAANRGWILDAAKISSENEAEISKLLQHCVSGFGEPLVSVRDLSGNIEKAIKKVIPHVPERICHYHFLENVGEKLCEKPHSKLTNSLRGLKIRAKLRSIRKDLVRWNKKHARLTPKQIDHLLSHPEQIEDFDAVTLRRLVAYVSLRWLDDYTSDLNGEYFPFDLPSLAFYRRGCQLQQLLEELLALPNFPQQELSTLQTISRHLKSLREDAEVVAAAERLEKAATLFNELRKVLRLSSRPNQRLLRGRGPSQEGREVAEKMEKNLEQWRDRLSKRILRERNEDKRDDAQTVLKYLEKYRQQLVGHVLVLEGREEPFVVQRTNNLLEHRFGATKQAIRRKVGTKKLSRHVQAMRAEAMLVANLQDEQYLKLVCGGSLDNLPDYLAKHWDSAKAIRTERQQHQTEHPMPTSKKQLRTPTLLDNIKKTVTKMVERIAEKKLAA
jgi:hypothetical protein